MADYNITTLEHLADVYDHLSDTINFGANLDASTLKWQRVTFNNYLDNYSVGDRIDFTLTCYGTVQSIATGSDTLIIRLLGDDDIEVGYTEAIGDADVATATASGYLPWGYTASGDNTVNPVVNGNGYTVSNVSIVFGGIYQGFIPKIGSTGDINNLSLTNFSITADTGDPTVAAEGVYNPKYVGGITGELAYGGSIDGCSVNGSVFGTTATASIVYVGGIGGACHGEINNCYTSGTVKFNNSNATVTTTSSVGGIIGYRTTGTGAGETGLTDNCISSAIVGCDEATIQGSVSMGGIAGKATGISGAIGYITNSKFTGQIAMDSTTEAVASYIGGIAGYTDAVYTQILDCINTANVDADGFRYIGGIVGFCESLAVTRCYNTGNVVGDYMAGGLCGYIRSLSVFSLCYNTGDISGADFVGGAVGYSIGAVSNSFTTGKVTGGGGPNNSGGFAGSTGATSVFTNCHSACETSNAYGFLGTKNASATITSCYWDGDKSTATISAAGTELTSAQMENPASFTNWDFEDIWYMSSDYPKLLVFGIDASLNRFVNAPRFNNNRFDKNRFTVKRYD